MKIECILRRDPPTNVILGATAYQFQADEQGRHVCEVEDPQHIARLLSISEAYRLPGDEPIPEQLIQAVTEQSLPTEAATLAPIDENVIATSTVHQASYDLGGPEPFSLDDVAAHGLELSGLTTAEWNALPAEDRHNLIDIALDDLDEREPVSEEPPIEPPVAKPTTETAPVSDAGNSNGAEQKADPDDTADKEAAELADLQAQYLAKFGKPAHHKQNAARLRELLAEKEGE